MDEKGKMNTGEYEELIKEVEANSPYKRLSSAKKKWMSVSEMGELLGLKKTDRYWLVHKNFFETKEIAGKMRVNIESFEKWYANQIKYHKVTGEEPGKTNKTVRVLKTPKTDSSVRKVFLPKSVAKMLIEWKEKQNETMEVLGDEYMDYNLVMASTFGLPLGDGAIRKPLNQLIKDYDLPPVVFHSLRHSSVTYKLKLNGGDIKAVQGDSGHAQVSMVTDVYSHILDDDRKKNAELFEEAFYEKKNLDPQMHPNTAQNTVAVPEGVDAELLAKVLNNPEMAALLTSLAKTMK